VQPTEIHFLERAGADAYAVLARLRDDLQRSGASVRLLRSLERDDLWLLIAEGAALPDVPEGTRTWRFAEGR
jgi:hypothetical protein